jgi:ABC-2 type transport system permease protein
VVLLSLGGGALLFNITHNSDGWLIFGIVFALIVSHAVIEIIYQFDIRGILRNKRQLLICGLAVGVIASCFRFDLFRFDSYLPEEDEIQSMAVSISGIESNIEYFEMVDGKYRRYVDSAYQLKNMKLTDFTDAYELTKIGISTRKNTENKYAAGGSYTYYVKYNLKNGKSVYRQYRLSTSETYQQLKKIYASNDFKEGHYPLLHWDTSKIGKVSVRYFSEIINHKVFGMDGTESYSLALPGTEKQEFLSTYMEELKTLTLDEVKDNEPLASLIFEYNTYDVRSYYIYPSFTKTLELLKKYGFDTSKKVNPEEIRRISVTDYSPKYEQVTVNGIISTSRAKDNYVEETYSDQEQIAQIMPNLISRDYFYDISTLIEGEEYTDVILFVYNEDYNNEVSYGYMFKKGSIPDFVKSDLTIRE